MSKVDKTAPQGGRHDKAGSAAAPKARARATGRVPQPMGKPASEKSAGTKQEIGGPEGPEPTRFGDWEKGGRCIDF